MIAFPRDLADQNNPSLPGDSMYFTGHITFGITMTMRVRLLFLAILFPILAHAEPAQVALFTLKRLVEAVRTGNSETVVELTYPKVHEMLGGREMMLTTLSQTFEAARSAGHTLRQVVIGKPSSIGNDGKRLFIFFPYIGVSGGNGSTTTIEAFYLGISEDNGNSWKFVDGSRMDQRAVKIFIPSYSGHPALPKIKHTTERN